MKTKPKMQISSLSSCLSSMAVGIAMTLSLQHQCSAQPVIWLKADTGVVTNAGGQVSLWLNQAGNFNHALQSDINKRPTLTNATVGCSSTPFPVIHFDGIQTNINLGDYMRGTNNVGLTNGFTSFVVYRKADRTVSEEVPALVGVPGEYDKVRSIYIRTSNEMAFSGWGNDYGTGFNLAPDVFRIWTDRLSDDKTTLDFFDTDGVNDFSTTVPVSGLDNPGAGYYVGGLGSEQRNFEGDIAEIIFYPTALDDTDRLAVEDYLRNKYRILPVPQVPVLWLKADAGVITNGSGQVTEWQDQSPNGNHAYQADANKAPSLAYSSMSCANAGFPVVRFDGIQTNINLGDFLQGTNNVGLTNGFTSFVVYRKADRTVSEEVPALVGAPGDYDGVRSIYIRTSNEMAFSAWDNDYGSGFNLPPDVFRIWTDRLSENKGTLEFFDTDGINNFDTSVSTSGLQDPQPGYFVGGLGSEQRNFQGDIAEIIFFDSTLCEQDRLAVEKYLRSKYGLANFPFAPVLWLKADAGVIKTPAGHVTEWQDQSGSGNHAYQSDTNRSPVHVDCSVHGFPVVHFDGIQTNINFGDFLQGTNSVGLTNGFTSFLVYRKADRTVSEEMPALVGVPGEYDSVRAIYIRTSNEMSFSGWGNDYGSGFDIPADTFRVWTDRLDDTKSNLDFFDTDGVNAFNTSVFTSGLSDPSPGYYVGGLDTELRNFEGDIAELIFFNAALTEQERLSVQNYLLGKYGLK